MQPTLKALARARAVKLLHRDVAHRLFFNKEKDLLWAAYHCIPITVLLIALSR